MMKFHAAILQTTGQVSARVRRDSAAMSGDPVSRRMMAEFKQLLCEKLTDDPTKTGKFWAKFGDVGHIMQWQQLEPLSAMGKFYVRGQIVAASFYMHGFAPDLDDAVLEATEVLFTSWFGGADKARQACRGLRSIKERPVVIVLAAGKSVLKLEDWHVIGNLCPCFAAVFFDRAEAAIKAVETYWHNRGFRKGGTATDFLRN
jgi:hypothetical protein